MSQVEHPCLGVHQGEVRTLGVAVEQAVLQSVRGVNRCFREDDGLGSFLKGRGDQQLGGLLKDRVSGIGCLP